MKHGISLKFVAAVGWCFAVFFFMLTLVCMSQIVEQNKLITQGRAAVAESNQSVIQAAQTIELLTVKLKDQSTRCLDARFLNAVVR